MNNVRSLAFSPDGRWLASGYTWGAVRLWDLETRRQVMEKSSLTCLSLSFSSDGRWLAAGDSPSSIEVMETASGKQIAEFPQAGYSNTLTFHPTKPWLVTGSEDHLARIWELPEGREIAKLEHSGPVTRVAFSPDGCFVASSEACPGPSYEVGMSPCRALVRVWEAATGVEVAQFPHEKGINDVAFSPDGSDSSPPPARTAPPGSGAGSPKT